MCCFIKYHISYVPVYREIKHLIFILLDELLVLCIIATRLRGRPIMWYQTAFLNIGVPPGLEGDGVEVGSSSFLQVPVGCTLCALWKARWGGVINCSYLCKSAKISVHSRKLESVKNMFAFIQGSPAILIPSSSWGCFFLCYLLSKLSFWNAQIMNLLCWELQKLYVSVDYRLKVQTLVLNF
jgi:hypothetical protein